MHAINDTVDHALRRLHFFPFKGGGVSIDFLFFLIPTMFPMMFVPQVFNLLPQGVPTNTTTSISYGLCKVLLFSLICLGLQLKKGLNLLG